jgi:hypothetical protein
MFGSDDSWLRQISHGTPINCPEQQFQDTLPLQSQISDFGIWSLNLSKPGIASAKLAIIEFGPWCSIVLSDPSFVKLEWNTLKWPETRELSKQCWSKVRVYLQTPLGANSTPIL